ncbi:uncharacterized protein LOC135835893 isoform X2 [Planococcus citri]|uniref:uncharacterized protein LOC135835893 isoform X2 n=1 Tax=Planococcus citri TaxID=170843 RepID=UPI0031F7ED9F
MEEVAGVALESIRYGYRMMWCPIYLNLYQLQRGTNLKIVLGKEKTIDYHLIEVILQYYEEEKLACIVLTSNVTYCPIFNSYELQRETNSRSPSESQNGENDWLLPNLSHLTFTR